MVQDVLVTFALFAAAGCGGGGSGSAAEAAADVPSRHNEEAAAPSHSGMPASDSVLTASDVPTTAGAANPPTMPVGPVIHANPANYLDLVRALQPGETLVLEPGNYDLPDDVPGLPLFNFKGTPTKPIMITGPESGPRPRILGRASHNTVRLSGSSHLIIRNLEIDGRNLGAAGVAAQGSNHDITLENLYIHGVGNDQQTVGISTVSAPNWNWTIRGNTIVGAGTGMYLGNSDGENAFINGLIEKNVVRDTIGYNLQIKHQNPRPLLPGMPTGKSVTVIRNNAFSKGDNSSSGSLARPNVLVGHFPSEGTGSDDHYEIYGNLFWQNPVEALFQGEGSIALYANVMVNGNGAALNIQPHHDVPKTIRIFGNTILAKTRGIFVSGGDPKHAQRVEGNAVFSESPITGAEQQANVAAGYEQAGTYLINPFAAPPDFDPSPRGDMLRGPLVETSEISRYGGWNLDYEGLPRDWVRRGAISGNGAVPSLILKFNARP